MILTLAKSISNDENRFKRVNVQKISSLKDLLNKSINEVLFDIKSLKELDEISNALLEKGETLVKIKINNKDYNFDFQLTNKRNIDRKTINLLRNKEILAQIS